MVNIILFALIFIFAPAGVLWLCKRVKFLGKIGPILLLYILGVIVGNLPFINEGTAEFKNTVTIAMIPIALPLMLFGCRFSGKDMKGIIRSLVAGLIAVIVSVITGYLIFGKRIENGPKIAGMLIGCETGGTINMASLQQALGVPSETYILLNSYDMIVCFLYFVFLLSVGIRLFRKILPHKIENDGDESAEEFNHLLEASENPYKGLWSKAGFGQILRLLVAVVLVAGAAFGVTKLFPKTWFMPVFILAITTFALALSFTKPIRKLDRSYDLGMYLIYIFSIAMASMADLMHLNLRGEIYTFLFLLFIIFVSLLVQLILSKLMKVEADMMIVSSVSLINSPPFVPMMVTAMKNKKVLVPGITVGIVGFAIGNYLGIIISQLLTSF